MIWTATTQDWSKLFTHIAHRAEGKAERIWCAKSQSSLLGIYFRASEFPFTHLLNIHLRYAPNTCSHCTKKWHRTYPICDASLSRRGRRSFAPSQKLHRNHRPYERTESLSGMVFVAAQKTMRYGVKISVSQKDITLKVKQQLLPFP